MYHIMQDNSIEHCEKGMEECEYKNYPHFELEKEAFAYVVSAAKKLNVGSPARPFDKNVFWNPDKLNTQIERDALWEVKRKMKEFDKDYFPAAKYYFHKELILNDSPQYRYPMKPEDATMVLNEYGLRDAIDLIGAGTDDLVNMYDWSSKVFSKRVKQIAGSIYNYFMDMDGFESLDFSRAFSKMEELF